MSHGLLKVSSRSASACGQEYGAIMGVEAKVIYHNVLWRFKCHQGQWDWICIAYCQKKVLIARFRYICGVPFGKENSFYSQIKLDRNGKENDIDHCR